MLLKKITAVHKALGLEFAIAQDAVIFFTLAVTDAD